MLSYQHVQVPSEICKKVKTKENLVYAVIRMHMNKETQESFPSMDTIASLAKLSKATVNNAIRSLEKDGHIIIKKRGRCNVYTFKSFDKKFERFTFDFIKSLDLDPELKSYIMGSFPNSYKDSELAISCVSDLQLSNELGISARSIARYDTKLEENHIMTKLRSKVKDPSTGLYNYIRAYDMVPVLQSILYVNEKTDKNTEDIEQLKKEVRELRQLLSEHNE